MTANNITTGIDLGNRIHTVCILSASDENFAAEVITNTRECPEAFAQGDQGCFAAAKLRPRLLSTLAGWKLFFRNGWASVLNT